MPAPLFSVTTPSFRSGSWLKLCIESVADQEGAAFEHIVQDAGSDDGTLDWLPQDGRVRSFVERDSGMYDAISRGWRRSSGEILSYLNCDEQYLPGALSSVRAFFERRPDVDLLFGDVVVVGPDGSYRFHRKMIAPHLHHTQVCHLSALTCAMFVRRSAIEKHDLYFDPKLRIGGDGEWVARALAAGLRCAVLPRFLSAFTDTGANMMASPNATRERLDLVGRAPGWVRALRPWWIVSHRLRKLVHGVYRQEPFGYDIHTQGCERRVHFDVRKPTFRWRLQPEAAS